MRAVFLLHSVLKKIIKYLFVCIMIVDIAMKFMVILLEIE